MSAKNFNQVVDNAIAFARSNLHEYLLVDHLAWALLEDEEIQSLLTSLGVQHAAIKNKLVDHLAQDKTIVVKQSLYTPDMPAYTPHVERVLKRAVTHKLLSGGTDLSTDAILLSILCENKNTAANLLVTSGVTRELVIKQLKKGNSGSRKGSSALDEYCRNLNQECQNGRIDPIIGRETEVQDMIEVLARRKKNNVMLVGREGVGKTALAEGLAKAIVDGAVPEVMLGKVVYSLDIGSMLAGAKFRGDFEERMKNVLAQVKELGNVILFIDEIHMIMGAGASGSSGSIDASNMMKPMLANGELTCVGATTFDECATHIEKDRALMRRFQKVEVNPPSVSDTKRILQGLAKNYEDFHKVTFTQEALDNCVILSERYIKSRLLPDKAIDVMDFAGAKAKLEGLSVVDIDMVIGRVAKISKVPLDLIDLRENEVLRTLDTKIKNTVFGQDEAVDTMVESIGLSKSGLRETNKPVGCFLFVGPTGTGKTYLCKTLAKNMGIELVKFDMSEYQEEHSVSRLIGAPPGYVGHGDGEAGSGQLIAEVEKHPSCVLLLDEIEKAAPRVLNILLQVMEDGVLTSSTGKKVDFSNVVLIMTSNLGAADAEKRSIGINNDTNDSRILETVNRKLSPEFRNRLDSIIQFKKLTMAEMNSIVDSAIIGLNDTLECKNIRVVVTLAARKWLATNGYDANMGARPFKRLFENVIKKPLSKQILFGDLGDGGDVSVSIVDDKIAFTVAKVQKTLLTPLIQDVV